MRARLPLGFAFLSLLAACQGNPVAATAGGTVDGGTGGAGGSTGNGDGGACISPTVGQPCTTTEVACQPPDPCCTTGYIWSCDGTTQTWQQGELEFCTCSPACGTTVCSSGEYCLASTPGTAPDGGGTSYTCLPFPQACAAALTPTCGCLQPAVASEYPECSSTTGGTCSDNGSGGLTVACPGV